MDRTKVQFDFLQDHHDGPLHFEDEIRSMGGNIYRVLVPQRDSLIRSRTCLPRFFRQHLEIMGVHMHANFPYALPLKYAQRAGIGLRILHSHNIEEYQHHENPLRALLWDMRGHAIAKDIDRYPTHYFACSDLAANFMFPNKPYTWIRNGIHRAQFAYNAATRGKARRELKVSDHTTVIGFCGGLRPQKNPLFLITMFERYHAIRPDSILVMVGDGLLRDEIERRTAEMNLNGCVRLLGQRSDVAELYQAMDASYYPRSPKDWALCTSKRNAPDYPASDPPTWSRSRPRYATSCISNLWKTDRTLGRYDWTTYSGMRPNEEVGAPT